VNKIETLGDYIKHVEEQEFPKKKLTFEEWLKITPIGLFDGCMNGPLALVLEQCWNAAQENK
jgi:hypothetical protein